MEYICIYCKKTYNSYMGLWRHKRKIHKTNVNIPMLHPQKSDDSLLTFIDKTIPNVNTQVSTIPNITQNDNKITTLSIPSVNIDPNEVTTQNTKNNCKICNKVLSCRSSKSRHEKACRQKKGQTTDIEKEIQELKDKIRLLESNSNHVTSSSHITNSNNTKNSNNNYGTINNVIYINKTGTENVLELNDKEITEIFDKELSCVSTLVRFINFNERLPHNHSFCSKSLEGKYLLTYDTEESKVVSTRKKYFYQELLENSVSKLELLYKTHKNKLSKEQHKKIEYNIERLKELKDSDFSNKILKELKNKLIETSYNCKDTVLHTWNNPNHKIEANSNFVIKTEEELLKELAESDTGGPAKCKYVESDDSSDESSDYGLPKPIMKKLQKIK